MKIHVNAHIDKTLAANPRLCPAAVIRAIQKQAAAEKPELRLAWPYVLQFSQDEEVPMGTPPQEKKARTDEEMRLARCKGCHKNKRHYQFDWARKGKWRRSKCCSCVEKARKERAVAQG